MKHKDVLELKKRLKKDHCTISQVSGCYVNSEKQIVATYRETFLNLEESEFFKYLEIAKKILSGTWGNHLLELGFQREEIGAEGRQAMLVDLKRSRLKDDELIQAFYRQIIDTYQTEGNFLILLFSDAYDVMKRTRDNLKLDESEETFEYILCAVCPVTLSDPGLHYEAGEQRMRALGRDWVVSAPAQGFLFPAFSEHSGDVNSLLYYTKNPREPHPELMETVLGCEGVMTTALQRESLQTLLQEAVGYEEEKAENLFLDLQEELHSIVAEQENQSESDPEPVVLTSIQIQDILADKAPEEVLQKIEEVYEEYFQSDLPLADRMLDPKALKTAEKRKKEQALEKQVENLKQMLRDSAQDPTLPLTLEQTEGVDVQQQVRPEKVAQIKAQYIDGQKCIIIPLEEDEEAIINGQSGIL